MNPLDLFSELDRSIYSKTWFSRMGILAQSDPDTNLIHGLRRQANLLLQYFYNPVIVELESLCPYSLPWNKNMNIHVPHTEL